MTDPNYLSRLLWRVNEKMVETLQGGATVPPSFWEEMANADEAFCEAIDGYLRGEVDREELDAKAVGYLNQWRELLSDQLSS